MIDDFGVAHVREAQADDAERVGYAVLVVVLVECIEVEARLLAVIEHCDEVVERLIVKVLLVERPALLVEREFVVARPGADGDDRAVGVLCVDELLAHEVILAAPEVDFVDVPRVRVLAHEPVHDFHGRVRLADLVVGARHLVQDPVIALVIRVLLEDLLVGLNGLARACRNRRAVGVDEFVLVILRSGQEFLAAERPLFELEIRLVRQSRPGLAAARRDCLRPASHLWRLHLNHVATADNAVRLLDLQVGQATHRFGGPCVLRGLGEIASIALRGTFETVLEMDFAEVRLHVLELRERALFADRGGTRDETSAEQDQRNAAPAHSASSSRACACVARS